MTNEGERNAGARITNFSLRLRWKLEEFGLPDYFRADLSFEARPDFPRRFLEFLISLYTIMRASVPLLKAAEEECILRRADGDSDSNYSMLAKYFGEHSVEEKDHDRWLLEDLSTLGLSTDEVLCRAPRRAVIELVGSQYYQINYVHPAILLGYIMILEGYPLNDRDLEQMREKTGFDSRAFRTLSEHSSLDSLHFKELDTTLDALSLSSNLEEEITKNAFYTLKKCTEILDSI